MLKVDYFMVCENVTFDEAKRPTILNISDQITIPTVPAKLEGAKMFIRMHPTDKAIVDQPTNFSIVAELGGENIWHSDFEKNITVEKNYGLLELVTMNEMFFPKFGLYKLKLLINGKLSATTQYRVKNIADFSEP